MAKELPFEAPKCTFGMETAREEKETSSDGELCSKARSQVMILVVLAIGRGVCSSFP